MQKNKGFTLIEILVALMIFAIMGTLAARSLQSIIHVHNALKKDNQQTMQLMMTMTLLRRDISEVIDRPILNNSGKVTPALVVNAQQIVFTRTGLLNPFNDSRQSNMQRIGYVLRGDQLTRLSWDVLDAVKNTQPTSQVLLPGVESIQWQCIASNGEKSSVWPLPQDPSKIQQDPIDSLPTVLLMVMKLKGQGVVQGIFPIPGRGYDASTQSTLP
ncbi:MAG: type II secretion system minor pseudopilin GspJ [Coxiellaceae bacterium]|nr:type II secretion system minor pseudopilin GspJ [Coxiellaceae bacterium]